MAERVLKKRKKFSAKLSCSAGRCGESSRQRAEAHGELIVGSGEISLTWVPETNTDVSSGNSVISDALQEQLGLKLELRKVPVKVIVIDSAQKPSELSHQK